MKTNKKIYFLVMVFIIVTLTTFVAYLLALPFVYTDTLVSRKWANSLEKPIQDISIAQNESLIAVMTDSLASINLNTGEMNWAIQLPSPANPYPSFMDGDIIFLLTNNSLLALEAHNATILWEQACDCYYSKILDVSSQYIVVNKPSVRLELYDAAVGKLLWSRPGGRGFVDAYIDGDIIYEVDKGIAAIDAQTGNVTWVADIDLSGSSAFSNGVLFYDGGRLLDSDPTSIVAFDVNQHKELWRTSLEIQGFSSYLISEETLFVSDQSRIYSMLIRDGKLIWKTNLSDPTNMAVMNN